MFFPCLCGCSLGAQISFHTLKMCTGGELACLRCFSVSESVRVPATEGILSGVGPVIP